MTPPSTPVHRHDPTDGHTHDTPLLHGSPVIRDRRSRPPRSLLGVGLGARLGFATAAAGVLWLAVLWALD